MNLAAFFDAVRVDPFGGALRQSQVDGLTTILDAWGRWFPAGDLRWLAYALATAFHETGRQMQPVRELGRGAGKPYGERDPETGHAYYGRGLVQLTWRDNYRKASALVGVDLVRDPDAALAPATSAALLILGMARGLFTGRKLGHYFNATVEDWVRARRVVNGLDRADTIAGYGRAFLAALGAAT